MHCFRVCLENGQKLHQVVIKMKCFSFFDAPGVKCERICRKTGSHEDLRRILKRNPKLNVNVLLFDNSDKTLLHIATLSGFVKCVEVLLARGANPASKVASTGNNSLHIASWMGNLAIVQMLCVQPDINIDEISQGGFTPLALACWAGHLDVCKYLLSVGASSRIANRHGYTPLLLASRSGSFEIVEHLLTSFSSDISETDHDGCTALHHASFEGRKDILKFLVRHGAFVEAKDKTGRIAKDLCKTRECAELLMNIESNKASIRTTFKLNLRDQDVAMTKLTNMSSRKQSFPEDFSRALGELDLSQQYMTRLSAATQELNTKELNTSDIFLQSNRDDSDEEVLDSSGSVGLVISARLARECWRLCSSSGDYRVFKRLLVAHPILSQGNPSPLSHLRDVSGWTLLMSASDKGFLDIAKILISIDPQMVHTSCPHGRTPLHLAAAKNHEAVARVLLSASASQMNASDGFTHVDHVTLMGRTALHDAAEFGHLSIARLLVYRGANENASDKDGLTPLHLSCKYSHIEMVIFLVTECCANPLSVTSAGEVPEDLTNNLRIKRLLRAVTSHRKKEALDIGGYSHESAQAWSAVEAAIETLRSTSEANQSAVVAQSLVSQLGSPGILSSASTPAPEDFKRAAWQLISQKTNKTATLEKVVANFRNSVSSDPTPSKRIISTKIEKSDVMDTSRDVSSSAKKKLLQDSSLFEIGNGSLSLRARLKQKYRLATNEPVDSANRRVISTSINDSKIDINNIANANQDENVIVPNDNSASKVNSTENVQISLKTDVPQSGTSTSDELISSSPHDALRIGNELKGSLLLTLILSQVYNVYSNKISRAFYRWKHRYQMGLQATPKSPARGDRASASS